MDLATFQHILEQRGLEGIAQRAQQYHADKWTTLFRTGDHEKEFEQLIDLVCRSGSGVHTITLSVHLNDPFWLQAQTGTRIQRAVLLASAQ